MVKDFVYEINHKPVSLSVEGEFGVGPPEVLLQQDDNLIRHLDWANDGFTVVPFLRAEEFEILQDGLRLQFIEKLHACGVKVEDDFEPELYHLAVDAGQHAKMVNAYRNFIDSVQLPISLKLITERISEVLGISVTNYSAERGEFYFIRFIRPGMQDFNPPHRDIYLNRIRNAINTYIPLWGSNELSSLPVLPGSHLLKESEIERTINEGPVVNGVKFTVPCITHVKNPQDFIRPNPRWNEVLIFSPYMIHGGAANFNPNKTRLSLEMRFWRAK